MNIFPPLAKHILNFAAVKKKLFPLLSQIGIHYRDSSLSKHHGDEEFKVKAGDRMPYVLVDGTSVYERLRQPKFHCLVFSNSADDFQMLKAELESEYADWIDFSVIPLDSNL